MTSPRRSGPRHFTRLRNVAILAATLGLLHTPAMAGSQLSVANAVVQPAMPGADSTTTYLKITNAGDEGDRLLGASARDFGHVEVHEMSNDDGMMGMRPLIYGLKIEAGETLDLNPLTTHIMLINPRRRFKVGQQVPISLHFLNAGTIRIQATVQPYRPDTNAGHTGH